MKHSLRNGILLLLSSLIIIFILIVDISFYKLPNFIKAFRYERELLIVIALLLQLSVIRPLYRRFATSLSRQLLIVPLSLLLFYLIIPPIYFIFKSNLILWDNNPLLALDPFSWNLFSTFTAIFTTIITIILFLTIHDLIMYNRKKYTPLNFNLLLLITLCLAVYFNSSGNRYDFEKIDLNLFSQLTGIVLFVLLALWVFLNAIRQQWVKFLNRRQKMAAFIILLIIQPFILYFYFSPFKTAIVSYSMTIKAFTFSGLFLGWTYAFFALLTVFFHLPTARIYDRIRGEIALIDELTRRLSNRTSEEKVLTTITQLCTEVLKSDYCWCWYQTGDSEKKYYFYRSRSNSTRVEDWIKEPIFQQIIREIKNKETLLFHHLSSYPSEKQGSPSIPIRSLLVSQLLVGKEIKGYLFTGNRQSFSFDVDDQGLFQLFSRQISIALENIALFRTVLENERVSEELKIASETQRRLLPDRLPEIPGYDIVAYCESAKEVGGDFYDFISIAPEQWGIVIADVSGKGSGAAFYMSLTKGVLTSTSYQYQSPEKILNATHKILLDLLDSHIFITLVYLVMDFTRHRITLCRAGHVPPLYFSHKSGQTTLLNPSGMALGITSQQQFQENLEQYSLEFHPGDLLLLYTDGISEYRNSQGMEFGEERLSTIIDEMKFSSSKQTCEKILKELKRFSPTTEFIDDRTLIIIKRGIANDPIPDNT